MLEVLSIESTDGCFALQRAEEVCCPRCGTLMRFQVESENLSDGTRRVHYYYKCPLCGLKVGNESLELRRVNKGFAVKIVKHESIQELLRKPRSRSLVPH